MNTTIQKPTPSGFPPWCGKCPVGHAIDAQHEPSMVNEFTSGGRPSGVAPIHLACNGKDHQPERCTIIHEMVRLSASPSLKVKGSGASPLHRAAGTGACDIVKVLLELGAHVDQTNEAGATPVRATSKSKQHRGQCQYGDDDGPDDVDNNGNSMLWCL